MVTWNHLWRMRPHHLLTIDHRFFHQQRRKIWVHWMSRQHDCSILQQQSARRYVNTLLLVLIGQNYQREENRADIWYLSISLSYYTFQKIAAQCCDQACGIYSSVSKIRGMLCQFWSTNLLESTYHIVGIQGDHQEPWNVTFWYLSFQVMISC